MSFNPLHSGGGDVHQRIGQVPGITRCAVNGCDALVYGSLNCTAHINPAHYQMNNTISQLQRTMSQPVNVARNFFEGQEFRFPEINPGKTFEPLRVEIPTQPRGQPPPFQGQERQYATMAATPSYSIPSSPSNPYWCPTHHQSFSPQEFAKHNLEYHRSHESPVPRHVEAYGNPVHDNRPPYPTPPLPPMRTVPPQAEMPAGYPTSGVHEGFSPPLPNRSTHSHYNGVARADITQTQTYGKPVSIGQKQQRRQAINRGSKKVLNQSGEPTFASAPRPKPPIQQKQMKPLRPHIPKKAIIVVDLTDESSPTSAAVPQIHRPASLGNSDVRKSTVAPTSESTPFHQKWLTVRDGNPLADPNLAARPELHSQAEMAPERQSHAPDLKQGPTSAQPPVKVVLPEQPIPRPELETGVRGNSETRTVEAPKTNALDTSPQSIVEEATTRQITPRRNVAEDKPRQKANVTPFDSDTFDALIYQQEGASSPPKGLSLPKIRKALVPPPVNDEQTYLHINPVIHRPYRRSQGWIDGKAKEIQTRTTRKKWFGRAADRQRWVWAQKQPKGVNNVDKVARQDPQPWSYNRPLDYGDLPTESLPQDVLQNAAWTKACAWHRDVRQMDYLRRRERNRQEKQTRQFLRSVLSAPSTR
ncbi:hypothetical protein HJFPF1_03738 [Paramyrothecium foliicola]|nr:hypothetical protein HJFPF1_03738 [Paramyrothecium foliicola]